MIRLKYGEERLTPKKVTAFEKKFGVTLPETYRNFILVNNGGVPEQTRYVKARFSADLARVYALGDESMTRSIWSLSGCLERGLLPIGETDSGEYFLLELGSGAVQYLDPHKSEVRPLDASIDAVLDRLDRIPREAPDPVVELGESGSPSDLDAFLADGNSVDAKTNNGWHSLIEIAAGSGNLAMVKACISRGAAADGAVIQAASGGYTQIIDYLLSSGRDINEEQDGRRAWDHANVHGTKFRAYMLAKGAKPSDASR